MEKIPSLYQRNYETDRLVRDEVTPGCEWVLTGIGVATRKMDGACCMIDGGIFYKRYDARQGRTPPFGFFPAQAPDPVTGAQPGWVRVSDIPDDKWFLSALNNTIAVTGKYPEDGTYEACGKHFNNNPERYGDDFLYRHGDIILNNFKSVPLTFEGIREYLRREDIEGIVWHRADGAMVKIKKRDFGLPRIPVEER